ncbi:MAG: flagellar hook-length control protein FliK, partial [Proteobacteria bacterium]|nr:flagellar hook-length control protein FliK [Pseudomonadota bacterium]
RNTAVTLSPAQMAEQRRAGQSVASGVANQGSVTAANLKTSDAGRTLMSASESADLTPNLDGPDGLQPANVARARMTAALDARPAVSSSAATLDPMAMAQGAMQDARLEGRLAQDSGGNRPVSFELPQATNTASSTTAPTVTGAPAPSGLSASAPAASSAAMRTGAEHVMQNVPWTPQFSDEVGEQVRVFVNNGLQEARLQLTPADLGRVQITINTEGDNARVVFVAETAAARDLLDQSMPRLREMLQQSGIQLAQGDVSDQAESQRRGEGLDDNARRLAQGEGDAQATDAEQALRPQLGNIDGVDGAGRVDTYI